jgi:hypothetical protein
MYQKLVLCALKTLGSSVEQYWYRVKIPVLSQYPSIKSLLWLMHLDMKIKNSMRGLGLVQRSTQE